MDVTRSSTHRRTARHEAGHALAAAHVGHTVTVCSIVPGYDSVVGAYTGVARWRENPAATGEDQLLVVMAGPLAAADVRDLVAVEFDAVHRDDIARVFAYRRAYGDARLPSEVLARCRAERFVRGHQGAIRALADRLLAEGTVRHAAVLQALANHPPEPMTRRAA